MISPKIKRRIIKIIPFGVLSALFSLVYVLLEKGILGDHPVYPSTGNPYNSDLLLSISLGFILGLLIGFLEILYLNKWFSDRSFFKKIIFKTIAYFIVISAFIFILSLIGHASELKVGLLNEQVWQYTTSFALDFAFISIVLYISLGIGVCIFYTEVSDNIGQSVLVNFLTGKYHHPIEEERIFMFLDMKS